VVTEEVSVTNSYGKTSLEKRILTLIEQRAKKVAPITNEKSYNQLSETFFTSVNTLFPATTFDVAQEVVLPVTTVYDFLEILRRRKKIKSRLFPWFNGEIRLYIPYESSWPYYLFTSCGECENWNRYTRGCTFFQELASKGYRTDLIRTTRKLPSKLTACKWRIARTKRGLKTFKSIQEFAEEAIIRKYWWEEEKYSYFLNDPEVPLPAFQCIYCKHPMVKFGWGTLPLVSSAIYSCENCSTFYKLIFDKKNDCYQVIVSKEKFNEYSYNYQLFTGGEQPPKNYCSEKYGLSLPDFDSEDLLTDIDTLESYNLYAYCSQLDFLVVKKEEQYQQLKNLLAEDHPQINILLANEQLKSCEPTKQQKGATKLLKHTMVANGDYAKSLLWNKIQTINDLEEFAKKERVRKAREEVLEIINELSRFLKGGKKLDAERWNTIDGRAANSVWSVVKPIMERQGFEMYNRSRARHLDYEYIRPWGLYSSFTRGNTIFNCMFGLITLVFIEICNKYDYPWSGLEGICHKNTQGGEYGFHLDNCEGLKQPTIAETIRLVVDGQITPEMVQMERMRKRMPHYFVKEESFLYLELLEAINELTKKKIFFPINGQEQQVTLRKAMEYFVLSLKKLLEDIVWQDEQVITFEGKKYHPWVLAEENKWDNLNHKQQQDITSSLEKIITEAKNYFQPFSYKTEALAGEFDFKL